MVEDFETLDLCVLVSQIAFSGEIFVFLLHYLILISSKDVVTVDHIFVSFDWGNAFVVNAAVSGSCYPVHNEVEG